MKSRGFALLGRDVQDYAQTAALAVFHLLAGFSSQGRVMLVEAARALGNLGLTGAVGMTTHPRAAMTALEAGVDSVG
jgi:hypothetical protein